MRTATHASSWGSTSTMRPIKEPHTAERLASVLPLSTCGLCNKLGTTLSAPALPNVTIC